MATRDWRPSYAKLPRGKQPNTHRGSRSQSAADGAAAVSRQMLAQASSRQPLMRGRRYGTRSRIGGCRQLRTCSHMQARQRSDVSAGTRNSAHWLPHTHTHCTRGAQHDHRQCGIAAGRPPAARCAAHLSCARAVPRPRTSLRLEACYLGIFPSRPLSPGLIAFPELQSEQSKQGSQKKAHAGVRRDPTALAPVGELAAVMRRLVLALLLAGASARVPR